MIAHCGIFFFSVQMQEKDKHALVYFNIVVEVTDNAVCVCVTQGREGDEAICPYR